MKLTSRPTIEDVASMAGVSISTVSRVLNDTAPVAESTLQRVQEAIDVLNYIPHTAARILASRKTHTVGLLLPTISGSFFTPMLNGIERGVRDHGYDLLIHMSDSITPRTLGEYNTDGLLIFTGLMDANEMNRLYQLDFPMLLLHQSAPDGMKIPVVTFENKNGARILVDYLIEERGYRRIAFLRGPDGNEDSYWREEGFRESLKAHNLSCDERLVGVGGFNGNIASRQVTEWIASGLSFDAIFAGDDDASAGAISAIKRAGLQVPQDIAVVGFDDGPLSNYISPALTTIRAPIEEAGYEAARQLIRLIDTGEFEELTMLPIELVKRASCGNPNYKYQAA